MIIRQPESSEDFKKYYRLRWEVLRKKWDQPEGSEKDELEKISFHAIAVNEKDEVVGVARLHKNSAEEGQIRFMGVREDQQGKGVGKKLVDFLEEEARRLKFSRIILQARENAVPFYLALGYRQMEKSFIMWNLIQHYRMEKSL
ncbi:MAG: GNAT family N-acetyltransferase [Bacteroidetes bacterium]|nr:GNAT family N-acetyltransferase [Bacteroidota bacterium]